MSLLANVLFSHRSTSTHHKLVLDALKHLRRDDAEAWRRLFLKHGESLLNGATAPDEQFKDFRNHVVHVREKCWGGAVESAETWYRHTVDALQKREWHKAAFAAGTLSHYYSDPLMPLHTALTEEAGIVHRACERSVFRSYNQLRAILERDLGGYPDVKVSTGPRWLAEMVKNGARLSHEHYDVVIDHYNIQKGWKNPVAGLDDELRVSLAECLGHAIVGIARIFDRAIDAAGVPAPKSGIGFAGLRAWFASPGMRWTRGRAAGKQKRIVKTAFKEFRKTGKVTQALPADESTVRKLHAEEVLGTTLATLDSIKPRAVGTKHGTGTYLRPMTAAAAPVVSIEMSRAAAGSPDAAPGTVQAAGATKKAGPAGANSAAESPRLSKPVPRLAKFHLDPTSSLADAPSVGNRTAEKLTGIGIRTVAQLLARSPEDVALRLKLGHIKADTVREWQIQARLACRVPNLRVLDVKILVACGICEPEDLAKCEALELLDRVDLFISTSEGQRAIRGGGHQPDLDVVTGWIESARHARALKAA
jgi:predicted flap endonuclease-1-like 5' DNA nuclease